MEIYNHTRDRLFSLHLLMKGENKIVYFNIIVDLSV